MPPKKGKGSDNEEKAILEYLTRTNRPYSGTDISSQLHGMVSTAQAKKILNELADDGKIMRKANGKQQIFYPIQTAIDIPSAEEAEEEEEAIKAKQEQVDSLKEENKSQSSKLKGLNNALTDDQMRERIAKLSLEIKENSGRLEQLRSGDVISPAEKNKIEAEHKKMLKFWSARKQIFKSITDAISEGYPGKVKDLLEELGVETDEAVGADTSILSSK